MNSIILNWTVFMEKENLPKKPIEYSKNLIKVKLLSSFPDYVKFFALLVAWNENPDDQKVESLSRSTIWSSHFEVVGTKTKLDIVSANLLFFYSFKKTFLMRGKEWEMFLMNTFFRISDCDSDLKLGIRHSPDVNRQISFCYFKCSSIAFTCKHKQLFLS